MNSSPQDLNEDAVDNIDLFIVAAEPSADLHGAGLIEEILRLRPQLIIGSVAGPKMRALGVKSFFEMEDLCVMGFIDVFFALPKLVKLFFSIRDKILSLNPKAIVFIDYPGFNLRLEKSLRKKGYQGKIVHYIAPTVWVWGKKRIELLEKNVDLLLTFFPFEKKYFNHTSLSVHHVGHPLVTKIPFIPDKKREEILALFPGSREKEIERNFPIQIQTAKKLLQLNPKLKIGVSISDPSKEKQLLALSEGIPVDFYPPKKNYELMSLCKLALATSGTVTLELALHSTPTIVQFAIQPIDLFIAQKILSINLPFYCIVNIIVSRSVFPELFGPRLTEEQLFFWTQKLWLNETLRKEILDGCSEVRRALGEKNAGAEAAHSLISLAF